MKNQATYDPPSRMQGEGPAAGQPGTQDAMRGVLGEQGRGEAGMVQLCESLAGAQDAMRGVVGDLRRIGGRMAELCENLPEPDDEFEALAELCGVVDCVNRDLIADAIRTLELAANHDEAELRREYEQRQRWLAAPRRIGDALL
jgi:hypothetical protein